MTNQTRLNEGGFLALGCLERLLGERVVIFPIQCALHSIFYLYIHNMTIAQARAILIKCESDLRSLVAGAATSGDYDTVLKLTSWARAVANLAGIPEAAPGAPALPEATKGNRKKKADIAAYPRFARRGGSLVKIGWSKSEKAEYEHKAPLEDVGLLVDVISKAGADGRIFQVGPLLPCPRPGGDSYMPDYQVYLVIAWWRAIGLLEQHGRQGYSIPKPAEFISAVEHASNDLIET